MSSDNEVLQNVRRFFTLRRLVVYPSVALVVLLIGLVFFRITFVNFVDNYELAYGYDALHNGEIRIYLDTIKTVNGQDSVVFRTGYFVTWPFVYKIHHIDLRPMQTCINANARVLNCKLVKFNPAGVALFLSWHGRGDYDGGSSVSGDVSTTTTRFNQILMSYAFDGTNNVYPFLDVLRELKTEVKVQ